MNSQPKRKVKALAKRKVNASLSVGEYVKRILESVSDPDRKEMVFDKLYRNVNGVMAIDCEVVGSQYTIEESQFKRTSAYLTLSIFIEDKRVFLYLQDAFYEGASFYINGGRFVCRDLNIDSNSVSGFNVTLNFIQIARE